MLTIKSLNNISIDTIHATFAEAFSDYQVDISYMTPEVMARRFTKNGFSAELSAGVFDRNRLVGFTVVGKGQFKGDFSAFDIMTGLIKDYRGKGLANQMFDVIKEQMKEQSINTFYLEVLQDNQPAIKAYEKTGFSKTRKFNCYHLELKDLQQAKRIQTVVYIDKTDHSNVESYQEFLDWEPSWENHYESIKRIPDPVEVFVARQHGKDIGVLVYYPTLNWILCLAVHKDHRRKGVATALLEYLAGSLKPSINEIKILNVPEDDTGMNGFLLKSGCQQFTGQFEMEYKLK